MADSDHSTAMPIVTRRDALSWIMRSVVNRNATLRVQTPRVPSGHRALVARSADPVVLLWRDWARDADARDRVVEDSADLAFEALASLPSSSIAGIAAKLDAVLSEGEVWEDVSQFPWPHVRSALDDLMRLFGEMMPADLVEVHRLRQAGVMRRVRRREGCGFHIARDFPTQVEIG